MHRNEVVLAGRLSMEPAHRELPSGALLTQWRLAVRRPGGRPGFQRSDAIECATFDDEVRDSVSGWQLDDLVEVEGALRRRWWRGGSRYEIEVRTARRLQQAPPRSRSRTGRARAEAEARDPGTGIEPDAADAGTGASGPGQVDGEEVSQRRKSA
ncbi:single-stranded DNA-binding protein [Microbispora cellulosiformans]|uniref:Single-stranded DNA-binding protein n=1 Tax=Microbispora cellulosiformans TaxID=2614688 RepID=A0A5J5JZJ5_9ACTN|nr:single-stranded DNA-binding protein [Microbispora cellulosiformans]KAA9377393.1 single-stranded DNA-binding protein [Microbispora cellulosiformans]